ncbi:hypothetical protein H696_09014 (mitochondrion) [Fonticula alba]|uniref:Uncharacterized protein n=1 Tax=Fonticula alba TaxID=691883 RepID=A0A058YYR6_FONAL|nr:hypothetical protein H696_09014 [Fonticula alba]KCV67170.1 hypothetical protein H696_09014 [Fonticula alba]|eukprot:XP_009498420.1 hypothetical protein H696_09014 (mitochondrion) [Fonticula alba]
MVTGKGFYTDFYILYVSFIHCIILIAVSMIALRALENPELVVDSLLSRDVKYKDKQYRDNFETYQYDADNKIKGEILYKKLEKRFKMKDLQYRTLAKLLNTLTIIKNDGHGKGAFRFTKSYSSIDDDILSLNQKLLNIVKDIELILYKIKELEKELIRLEMSQDSKDRNKGFIRTDVEASAKTFLKKEKRINKHIPNVHEEYELDEAPVNYFNIDDTILKQSIKKKINKYILLSSRANSYLFKNIITSPSNNKIKNINKIKYNLRHIIKLENIQNNIYKQNQTIKHNLNYSTKPYNIIKIHEDTPNQLQNRLERTNKYTYKQQRKTIINLRKNIEIHNKINKMKQNKKTTIQLIKLQHKCNLYILQNKLQNKLKRKYNNPRYSRKYALHVYRIFKRRHRIALLLGVKDYLIREKPYRIPSLELQQNKNKTK